MGGRDENYPIGTYPGTGTITIDVVDGYFTTTLDFGGGIFDGEERWLEIEVNGTLLSPLQPLTPAPYAIYAQTAPWSGLTDVPAGLYDGDDDTTYSPGYGLALDSTTFNVMTDTIQARVSEACGSGYAIRQVNADGSVVCETDDDTIYTNGYGLDLNSTQFSVDILEVQSRVIGSCADGWSIRTIYADGTVYCEIDDDTTYTSGYGLYLVSGQFSVNPGEIQNRVVGSCPGGYAIRTIYGDGTVYCEIVDDTTSFWSLSGNASTNLATNFLGTVDNVAMEIRVNNQRAFRIEPNDTSPNLVGGSSANSVTPNVYGATITGGGSSESPGLDNLVTDSYGTVCGGAGNQAGNDINTVNDAFGATVGGGGYNFATAFYSTVSGGSTNQATNGNSTVSGGTNNQASGHASTVGGGIDNQASGYDSTVGGGNENTASLDYSTVSGGELNQASGVDATIGGGKENIASGTQSTVAGGADNTAGYRSTVSGGLSNMADSYGAVPGGYQNFATGFSFAAGRRAKADHQGSFVFADTNDFDFATLVDNSFKVRTTGGVRFVVGIDGSGNTTWSCVLTYGNNWSCTSDRNMKENFKNVEGREILERLSEIPIQRWNAIGGDPDVDHISPMAQDFYAAFGLGEDERLIGTMDANGVALAAIQGLYTISQEQAEQIEDLQAENASLREQQGMGFPEGLPQHISILVYGLAGVVVLLIGGFIWILVRFRSLLPSEASHVQ